MAYPRSNQMDFRGMEILADAFTSPVANTDRVENVYGETTSNLQKFRSAAGKVRAGVAGGAAYRSTIVFIGDSKTMGAGADGSAGNTAGAEPISKPSFFATLLAANGLPVSRNTSFGYRGTASPAALTAYDGKNTFDASLGLTTTTPSLGGYAFTMGGLLPQTFTPTGNTDKFAIYTRRSLSVGDGILGVDVDASANVTTINCGITDDSVQRTLVSTTLGAHAYKWHRNSGNFIYVIGAHAYDSTASGFDLINAGAYGSQSSFHVGTNFTADKVLPVIPNLSLVFIQLGTNDLNASVPVTTTLANLQTLITAAKAAGADVVLEYPTYGPDGQFGTTVTREQLRQGMIDLGTLNNIIVVDHATRFISYAQAFANGLMGSSVHEVAAGYADEAAFLANTILR